MFLYLYNYVIHRLQPDAAMLTKNRSRVWPTYCKHGVWQTGLDVDKRIDFADCRAFCGCGMHADVSLCDLAFFSRHLHVWVRYRLLTAKRVRLTERTL